MNAYTIQYSHECVCCFFYFTGFVFFLCILNLIALAVNSNFGFRVPSALIYSCFIFCLFVCRHYFPLGNSSCTFCCFFHRQPAVTELAILPNLLINQCPTWVEFVQMFFRATKVFHCCGIFHRYIYIYIYIYTYTHTQSFALGFI